MSKVALRVYNRDIEALIDQGHLDEAIAHCQHVLKIYPKYLETYRLLGKAYLEARRFGDAADIFQRVLLAAPDDFVSHLGMSIIYDEQKDLDKAIWHMERAYEITPSNAGVQGELRRLYGRRDGLEPPKIRLTRGALAQMYTKGGQYQQAIVEIKSVLGEDPTRSDMKILLARAYFRAGMKVEAAEMCTELLKQYPYSLDGNRILVDILPGTSLAGSVDQYKKRVQALDPYAALVTGSLFDADGVPDAAVAVDRLEFDSSAVQETSWQAPTATTLSMPEIQPSTENLPDWMKQAGWGTSTGEFQEGPVSFDEPEESAAAAGAAALAAAEIPDWLKAMAPPGSTPAQPQAPSAGAEQPGAEDLDWLAGLGGPLAGAESAAQPPAEQPAAPAASTDWMQDLGQASAAGLAAGATASEGFDWLNNMSAPQEEKPAPTQPPAAAGDVPDWLSGLGSETAPKAEEPAPDWLSGLSAAQPEMPAAPSAPALGSEKAVEAVPDWLSGLGETQPEPPISVPAPTSEVESTDLDWLSGLGLAQPETPVAQEPSAAKTEAADLDWLSGLGAPTSEPAAAQTGVPDWLGEVSTPKAEQPPAQTEPVADWLKDRSPASEEQPLSALISGPGTTESEQDEALKWLESLAQKQGAKSEELITNPAERTESAPGWVSQVGEAPVQPVTATPAPYIPEKPIEVEAEPMQGELSPVSKAPGTGPLEQDQAMKWLESLAEKQGAKAEELITPPAERTESAPSWVEQVQNPPTELSALISGPGTSESEQDDAMKWLESLAMKQGAKSEELITNPEERRETLPDWVSQVGAEPPVAAQPPAPEPPAHQPVTPPPAPTPAPRPVQPDVDGFVPGPLSELISGPGTSASEQDDAMKWLESLAMKQGAKSEELITNPDERRESLPDWVSQVGSKPPVAAQPPAPQPVTPPPAPAPTPRPVQPDVDGFVPGPLSELISGPGTSESEQDDAMKWLESLAMKQGAKSEELITNPDERHETLPGWVSQVGAEPPAAAQPPVAEAPGEAAAIPAETLPWEAPAEPVAQLPAEEQPAPTAAEDWLASLEQPTEQKSSERMPWEQEAPVEPAAAMSWEQPATETPVAEAPAEVMPWEQPTIETPAAEIPAEVLPWEQLAAEKPAELMPWEHAASDEIPTEPLPKDELAAEAALMPWEHPAPETPVAETPVELPAAEAPVEAMPWEQPVAETPAEPLPWEQPGAETPVETLPWETPAAEAPVESMPWEQEQPAAETPTAEIPAAAEAAETADVSAWLKSLDEQPVAPAASAQPAPTEAEELPDWLKDMSADEQPPAPTQVAGWMPAEATPAQPPVSEAPVTQTAPQAQAETAKVAETAPAQPSKPTPPPPLRLRPTTGLTDKDSFFINRARDSLLKGSLEVAMGEYVKLIKKGKLLEEVIDDLKEVVYRHPVDVVVWQTLGDAYMRSNRLQEALDAYTKAEELVRR